MDANMVLALGLGMRPPWRLVGQRLDTGKQPHELHLDVCAERGSLFACPVCSAVLQGARLDDHHTAMPVSKGSTACSRPPGPVLADIATSQPSRP